MNIYKQLLELNDLEDFCRTNNIIIESHNELAVRTKGFCFTNGFEYFVILNPKHGYYQLKLTLMHELIHVFENHFIETSSEYCEKDVKRIIKELKKELGEYFIY